MAAIIFCENIPICAIRKKKGVKGLFCGLYARFMWPVQPAWDKCNSSQAASVPGRGTGFACFQGNECRLISLFSKGFKGLFHPEKILPRKGKILFISRNPEFKSPRSPVDFYSRYGMDDACPVAPDHAGDGTELVFHGEHRGSQHFLSYFTFLPIDDLHVIFRRSYHDEGAGFQDKLLGTVIGV